MATDEDKETIAKRDEPAGARSMFDVLLALQQVAKAELAKGPGISSTAWRTLHDAIAEAFGDEPIEQATPVVGRQPLTIPPGFKNPIPAKGGAVPVRPDQEVLPSPGDIRKRPDVEAELARVKRGR